MAITGLVTATVTVTVTLIDVKNGVQNIERDSVFISCWETTWFSLILWDLDRQIRQKWTLVRVLGPERNSGVMLRKSMR